MRTPLPFNYRVAIVVSWNHESREDRTIRAFTPPHRRTPPCCWSPAVRASRPFLLLGTLLAAGCGPEAADPGRFPIIPLPQEVESMKGEFLLTPDTRVVLSPAGDAEVRRVAEAWAREVRASTGLPLPMGDTPGPNTILVEMEAASHEGNAVVPAGMGLPGVEAEGYELEISHGGVTLKASAYPGIFYGLETLSQLITPGEDEASGSWVIPAGDIDDQPRFRYRGMHLDVGRHFFPTEFVKRYIDFLALYKMNVFHWHLTEDQGWRIEIEGYPALTEVGSCRAETILEKNFDPYVGDGVTYCGFYTQDEIREVVAYARERFITVIPEIEMPGHSVAALAAYPGLACTDGPFQPSTRWGVTEEIYCPKEETFAFLEDVLTEVMELFPSPYIHIGGDEAPKTRWEESEVAQEVMRREGLADEDELQSWFIRRIEGFLNANGRRLVGWDEILEGGLAPNATVMSWRGIAGGVAAARQKHDVIMTPNSHVYLDFYQGDPLHEPLAIGGFSPLERVYAFEPVPPELSEKEAAHILGAQGNLWTEYIATTDHVEYMILPRLLALSEVVWSPREARDWESFRARLPNHFSRLDGMGAHYRIPDVFGLEKDFLTLGDWAPVRLSTPMQEGEIRFTLDGSDPTGVAPVFEGPFDLMVDEAGLEMRARVVLPDGRMGGVKGATFRKTSLAPSIPLPVVGRHRGLEAVMTEGSFASVFDLPTGPGNRAKWGIRTTVPWVRLPDTIPQGVFGAVLVGFIHVPRPGIYTFHLSSDDGSSLGISERMVVNHDGYHSNSTRSGQVALQRGWHPLQIRYFQGGGGASLGLEMEGPELPLRRVPAHWLAHLGADAAP